MSKKDQKAAEQQAKAPTPEELASADANLNAGTAVSTQLADIDYAADAGLGQNFSAEDLAIPRLGIIQSTSKQLLRGDKNYIEGAQIGMIYDNVSKQLWSGEKGVILIPVSYRHTFLEWIPPKMGGGFVKDWAGDASIVQKCTQDKDTGQLLLPDGHEIVQTAEYYVMTYNEETGATAKALLSMAKTQYRKAKQWNTMINQLEVPHPQNKDILINPAMFFRSYKLTTQPESNEKGHWFGWVISGQANTLDLTNGRNIYIKARDFFKDVQAGKVKVAEPEGGSYGEGSGGGADDSAPM